ncbi:GntR domain protein [Thermovirga lienii DSM 17291]|jgi:GntR family transcriptional repressor for pyruvate dehydrogenase complex|uniref:GntR domain protein n=1 Tax=Thermovirga lienii (strain ATCC BAA-1197 / DSM 17291 / Cas60314) TaxID=580340 RepID=G7V7G6_THELD|nr:FadR/GntR family transcriptional regulator [Thermovirga lienii]AER67282.1 GntR domain protein [Thermovirga lienii DSM 17291]MDN5318217.1 GntR family transcriptional regulator, transcriptional repressor for pyruvate dehydrogenase complex [Thermovirga sp.]MDN5367506.1 GntR family transcriptional regulator, transcriptional repressor for pyruvate dehydrogenase complex [Thermovirga sp.]
MPQRKIKGTRIYEQVVEEIKRSISSGELKPGDPLPSERQLMSEMGVSRSSLREAFRILELLGLIESIPGKGRFVRKPRPENKDLSTVPLEDEAILELMEARRILDPAICKIAAMHALPSNLTQIRKILSKTSQNIENLSQRAKLDYDFHLALAEATHNFVFVNVVKMTFNLIMATHERIYSLLNDKEAFLNEHQEIYEAIMDHNVNLASDLAAKHIDRIYKTLQEAMAK